MAISDRKLAELAREREELDVRINKLKAMKAKRDNAIIQELERRGTKAIETAGLRITKVQSETVKYDLDGLRNDLPRPKLRLITKEVIDKDALERAVATGKVDLVVVNRHSSVTLAKPYIKISGADE